MTRRSGGHQASIGLNAAQGPLVATYQTRISDYGDMVRAGGDATLSAYSELYGQVQRKLFADVPVGGIAEARVHQGARDTGADVQRGAGVAGRQGVVRPGAAEAACGWSATPDRAGERQVAQAEQPGRWQQVHQKRRRLANLRSRLAGLEADIAAGRVRLCFGSKRLWRKQHHLEQNGYASHEEWFQDWRDARSDEFFAGLYA